MELEMDYLTSRILLQKTCSYRCQFCIKSYTSSRLVSEAEVMSEQSIKKIPDVSALNQNVERTCNSKLKLTEPKDLFIKKVQKN